MSKKEYPMDENYNQALKFLTEQIAERDELSEQLKLLSPADRPEGLRLLAELDKSIERGEQALANEYEVTQNLRRTEEERDEVLTMWWKVWLAHTSTSNTETLKFSNKWKKPLTKCRPTKPRHFTPAPPASKPAT